MPLARGTRLGPYEVLAPLGAGGMGEVWRARDTRLARDVALKVLPDHLSDDPKALARFESEAKAVAALSHPHILAIHDVGRADGVSYVVTELLEGETLRAPLLRGPLPLRKALDVAAQLADALAAAHEKGIVHRDVKPENVVLTKEGRAKLLDFGLARHDATFRSDDDSRSPTVTRNTDPGAVVGTIAYMSPEQARGLPAGFGSDQFSLGVVLYEMLSGRRPFHGPSSAETLVAIIRSEPEPLEKHAPATPAPVRWILDRLLAKDPAERYAATRDLARDLENCRLHLSEAATGPALRSRKTRSLSVFMGVGALFFLTGLAGALLFERLRGPEGPPSFRKLTFGKGSVGAARFTPDGFSFVYTASWEESASAQQFLARFDVPAAAQPTGHSDAAAVALRGGDLALLLPRRGPPNRPGSASLAASLLATVPIGGGAPRPVLDEVLAADWSPDGTAFAVVRNVDGRDRLEFPPGRVLFEASGWIRSLAIAPGGDAVAFAHWTLPTYPGGDLLLASAAGGTRRLSAGWAQISGVRWAPDGSEVWFSAGRFWGSQELHAVRRDGKARLLAKTPGDVGLQDVSADGRAILTSGASTVEIRGHGPEDERERAWSWLDGSGATGISADGRTLLLGEFAEGGGVDCAVYVRRLDGTMPVRLGEGRPRGLSPDGTQALVVTRRPAPALGVMPTGPGEARVLPRGSIAAFHWASFFPDGRRILIVGNEAGRPIRLFVQDAKEGSPRALSPEGIRVAEPSSAVSPDGTLVAATFAAGDQAPVLLRVVDGVPVPIDGLGPGEVPLSWSQDGTSLYVRVPSPPDTARVVRFDLASRRRTPWRELRPPDPTGAALVYQPVIARDGEVYFYTVTRRLSNLFLVEGLR